MLNIRTLLFALLLSVICLAPARGESVIFKNDCKIPLLLQIATVQRGVLVRDQCTLRPGEATIKLPLTTDKVVTLVCARTGRPLLRDGLRPTKNPLTLSIAPDPRMPTRLRLSAVAPGGATAMKPER